MPKRVDPKDFPDIGLGKGAQDLKGRKFGRLTALHQCGAARQGAIWLCECRCGEHAVVVSKYLVRDKTTHCGCKTQELPLVDPWSIPATKKPPLEDLAGQTFGALEPVFATSLRISKGPTWVCRCKCGRHVRLSKNMLQDGLKQSCGHCKYKPPQKEGELPSGVHAVHNYDHSAAMEAARLLTEEHGLEFVSGVDPEQLEPGQITGKRIGGQYSSYWRPE